MAVIVSQDTLLMWLGGILSTSAFGVTCYTLRLAMQKVGQLGASPSYQRLYQSASVGDHCA